MLSGGELSVQRDFLLYMATEIHSLLLPSTELIMA